MMKHITKYSAEIKGARGNYNWSVSFDKTNGYIGILQTGDHVLLSPAQFKALVKFAESK